MLNIQKPLVTISGRVVPGGVLGLVSALSLAFACGNEVEPSTPDPRGGAGGSSGRSTVGSGGTGEGLGGGASPTGGNGLAGAFQSGGAGTLGSSGSGSSGRDGGGGDTLQGGSAGSGGRAPSTGGASAGTTNGGGSSGAAAGASAGAGKSSAGGASASGGSASGGSAGGGSASGGSASGGAGAPGGTGGTTAWTASDYASRKWARWPIPNPVSMGLPHPMSFTPSAEGVVDNVTGLVWQKSTNTGTTNWQGALDYCKSLGDGWSLPTRIELTSIVDTTRSGPKVEPVFTFGNGAGWTWASTPWVVNQRRNLTGAAALSWFINFALGDSNNSLSQTATSAYSRCVKIPTTQVLPAQHYTAQAGEVKDNYTGLTWQQGHSGSTASLSWDQADAYCKSLSLNGQTWRLPSLNELASIVDDVPDGDVSPSVDHVAFPMTSPELQYWSASRHGTTTTERWTLNFKDGFTAHRVTSTVCLARCVR